MNQLQGVRAAERDDVEQLAQIESQAFAPPANRPWTAAELAAELATGRLFLVAHGGKTERLGYLLFRVIGDEAELLRTAVRPSARRRGVARALLTRAVHELEAASVTSQLLEVRADNGPAIALYEAFGFKVEGRRSGYYPDGVDALLMRRRNSRHLDEANSRGAA